MSAGSSQDIGAEICGFVVPINEPPVVEIDTEATAAYLRLSSGKVARTEPFGSEAGFVFIDFDESGEIVGLEFVGQQEFSIRELIRTIPVQADDEILNRTRYVAAKKLEAA